MKPPSDFPSRQPETHGQETNREQPSRRFAAVQQDGRLELVHGDELSRILVIMLGDLLARLNRGRREVYDGDLDLASVFEIIGITAVEHSIRDAKFREEHGTFATVVGASGQRGTNAMSISAGTGIPRETVRRKIKRLLELGMITEQSRGRYVVTPGIFLRPEYQRGFAQGIRDTVQFMNQCLEQGVMRWVPNQSLNKSGAKE